MRSRFAAVGLVALLTLAAAAGRQRSAVWPLVLQTIASPAGPESAQPQLTVSSRGVLLSWIERSASVATLKFSERLGSGWSGPVTAASGGDWFVNWADVPSVLRLADGSLAAHWLEKSGPGTYAYDVRLSQSRDDGATWSTPVTPHHDGTRTEHGFASLFQMPGAGLGLVWLDGRATAGAGAAGHGGHGAGGSGGSGGSMTLRFAAFGRDGKQTSDAEVDARVCDCCPTAAAVTADGIVAAFRDRSDDEIRDIAIARLENGRWSRPVPVHQDNWRIAACPVNGPALSARGRDVAVAWFSMRGDRGHAFAAFSSDAGRSFGAPVQLDDVQSTGRVDVELLPDGSAAVMYLEFAGDRAQIRVRRVERSGARSEPITVAGVDSGRTSGYPRMALHGSELVFAWIEREGSLRVKTSAARLPARATE